SVGDRPRTAARRWRRPEDAFPPLHQSRSNGIPSRAAARRLHVGSRRSDVHSGNRTRVNLADARLARADAALSVRPYRDADRDRWERYVDACPQATFFHRIGWRDIIGDVFRHRTHYLLAERGDRIVGVLPLAQVRSRLFGHSLVSLPFA